MSIATYDSVQNACAVHREIIKVLKNNLMYGL